MKRLVSFLGTLMIGSIAMFSVTANANRMNGVPGPCKEIAVACQAAGFSKGDWRKGDGLWRDCVNPIIQGATNAPGISKPLPKVDPGVVAACKAKRPKFGEGKLGT